MSVQQMGRVWESDLEPNLKLVALALADMADDQGWCWPAIATIAGKAGYSRRQTQRLVGVLVDLGYVRVHEPATQHRTPTYRLYSERLTARGADSLSPPHRDRRRGFTDQPRGDVSVTSAVAPGVTSATSRGDICDTPGVTSATSRGDNGVTLSVREPSVEPSLNRKKATRRVATLDTTTVDRVTNHTPSTLHADTTRPANPLWDALEATFGYRPVGAEARLWGKLVNQLATMGAHPDDVTVRAQRLLVQWGPDKLTPTSLVKHWQRFGSQLGTIHLTERERAELVARQRLADELDALPDNALEAGR